MLPSPTAENKRIFQLRQECVGGPEMRRSIRTSPTVIPINVHRDLHLQHQQQEFQHSQQLQLQLQQHHLQQQQQQQQQQHQQQQHQQRMITSAHLPPHQKIHTIQLFKQCDVVNSSNDVVDGNNLTSPTGCNSFNNSNNEMNCRLKGSNINQMQHSTSFLPPINPSSTSSLKKKKKNFITNAVAALTSSNKTTSSSSSNNSNINSSNNVFNNNVVNRSRSSSTSNNISRSGNNILSSSSSSINARNASPMRRQEISPGRKKTVENLSKKSPDVVRRASGDASYFRKPSFFTKSSSNPTLTDNGKQQGQQASNPQQQQQRLHHRASPSPTRQKLSPSPVKKQSTKMQPGSSIFSQRRMSLPLNKNVPQQCFTNVDSKSTQQQQQTPLQQKPQLVYNIQNQQFHPSNSWSATYHCPQQSEPIMEAGPLLLSPVSQKFIQSQRILSRVKSANQAPTASGEKLFDLEVKPTNCADHVRDHSTVSAGVHAASSRTKENIYEEIDASMRTEAKCDVPVAISTSTYQSPSLSSSSSSSSFFLSGGKNEPNLGDSFERSRVNQKSLDDGYSSQDCQVQNIQQHHQQQSSTLCSNKNNNMSDSMTSTINRKQPSFNDAMTASVIDEQINRGNRAKLERHFSLDGKNSKWRPQPSVPDFFDSGAEKSDCFQADNGSWSDDYASDLKPPQATAGCIHVGELRPSNVRLGSRGLRCGTMAIRRPSIDSCTGGPYQTMPKVSSGSNSSTCCCHSCEKSSREPDSVCCRPDDGELRRLRMLIWTERKNNEERETEVERRWVARMEGVVAEARSIEQSLRSQIVQLRKQCSIMQDQLRQAQVRVQVSTFNASTQTVADNFSKERKQSETKTKQPISQATSLESDDSVRSFNKNINTSTAITAEVQSSDDSPGTNTSRLTRELELCKKAMEEEKIKWMNEKNSVIEYQQRLQLSYIQVMKKNEILSQELHQLTVELEKLHQQNGRRHHHCEEGED